MKTIRIQMSDTLPHLPPKDFSKEIAELGDRYLGKGRRTSDFPDATPGQVVYIPATRRMYEKAEKGWTEKGFEFSFLNMGEELGSLYVGRLETSQDDILKILLIKDIVFINTPHWDDDLPKEKRNQYVAMSVNVNDVFGPMADAEGVTYHELPELMTYCLQFGFGKGPVYWAVTKRRCLPWIRPNRNNHGYDQALLDRCVKGELIID